MGRGKDQAEGRYYKRNSEIIKEIAKYKTNLINI